MDKSDVNVLCTICARAGSKGVKSKNTKMFLEYPLVYYTLAAYRIFAQTYGDRYAKIALAVNTDSEELLKQCGQTNVAIRYIARRESLGGDRVAKADVICDTLRQMEQLTQTRYDIVLDLDLTAPLRTAADIEGCLEELLQHPQADVAYSVTNARRLPYFNMVKKNEAGYLQTVIESGYATRQEAPECYDMNASIYAYRRGPLLKTEEKDIFTGNAVGWVMMDTSVLDIDSEEDYELMGVLADYFYRKYPAYGQIRESIEAILK